jgi:hypothetical protein
MIYPKKIHIIGNPRSGTSYLMRVLAHYHHLIHGDVRVFGEPFNLFATANFHRDVRPNPESVHRYPAMNVSEAIRAVHDDLNWRIHNLESEPCIVVKNHIFQLGFLGIGIPTGFLSRITTAMDYHILILRRDVCQTVMSLCIANITGEWNQYTNKRNLTVPLANVKKEWFKTIASLEVLYSNQLPIVYDERIWFEDAISPDAYNDFMNLNISRRLSDTQLSTVRNSSPPDMTSIKSPSKQSQVLNLDEVYDYMINILIPSTDSEYFQISPTGTLIGDLPCAPK